METQGIDERSPVLLPNDADNMLPARFPPTREAYYPSSRASTPIRMPLPMRRSGWPGIGESEALHRADKPTRDEQEVSRALVYRVPDSKEKAAAVDRFAALMYATDSSVAADNPEDAVSLPLPTQVPAWLSGPEDAEVNGYFVAAEDQKRSLLAETLEGSRERMASRRFGLNQALQGGTPEILRSPSAEQAGQVHASLLMVFSIAGGVGKTSLVATLGRALSFAGENVLLADATPHGLLPFYYGVKEGPTSAVRHLSPPPGRPGVPVHLLTFKVGEDSGQGPDSLKEELARASEGASCILLDTSSMAASVLSSFAASHTRVLVPLSPDMNSVITLAAVEKFFAELTVSTEQALQPVYLLVGFDSAEALHLDVREVLRQQLGDRLLPCVIRRSSTVAEALAEGMTVIDFAPEAVVASDYMAVAQWVCSKPAEYPLSRQGTLWNEH